MQQSRIAGGYGGGGSEQLLLDGVEPTDGFGRNYVDAYIVTHYMMLRAEFLEPLGTTQIEFAARLGVSYPRLNEIIRGRRSVTPETALKAGTASRHAGRFLARPAERLELWQALHSEKAADVDAVQPLEMP